MATRARTDWGAIFKAAILAGIVGAITIDLYLWLTTIVPAHGSIVQLWQYAASGAIGQTAYTSPAYVWFGLLIHLLVSIGWAGGYAYLAQTRGFLNERWPISGLFYGFVVYLFMRILLLGAHLSIIPASGADLLNVIIAHCIFFGIPVAYVVAKQSR